MLERAKMGKYFTIRKKYTKFENILKKDGWLHADTTYMKHFFFLGDIVLVPVNQPVSKSLKFKRKANQFT